MQDAFASESLAASYATTLWNLFLGGTSGGVVRPFGSAVLDGFDFDIEAGSSVGWASLISGLRAHYATDATRTYYISGKCVLDFAMLIYTRLFYKGAPQCVFPDNYLGNALSSAQFDFVFIQFYNNFCGIQNFGSSAFNFGTWNNWASSKSTKIFLGVPGAAFASGSGYVSASTMNTAINGLHVSYGVGKGWFAGVMIWDVGAAGANGQFGASVSATLKSFASSSAPPVRPSPPSPPSKLTSVSPPILLSPPVNQILIGQSQQQPPFLPIAPPSTIPLMANPEPSANQIIVFSPPSAQLIVNSSPPPVPIFLPIIIDAKKSDPPSYVAQPPAPPSPPLILASSPPTSTVQSGKIIMNMAYPRVPEVLMVGG